MIESGFALLVAFFINVSVISVSGAVCNSPNLNLKELESCENLDLNEASFLLKVQIYLSLNFNIYTNIINFDGNVGFMVHRMF